MIPVKAKDLKASCELLVSTSYGDFKIGLSNCTPSTSAYFLNLAKNGILNNTKIFRIVTTHNQGEDVSHPIEVVQIGTDTHFDVPLEKIPHERTDISNLLHKKWTVSAARFEPGEVYKSFFICMRDEPELDAGGNRNPDGHGFAAFGKVISGFSVVEHIFRKAESNELLKNTINVHSVLVAETENL